MYIPQVVRRFIRCWGYGIYIPEMAGSFISYLNSSLCHTHMKLLAISGIYIFQTSNSPRGGPTHPTRVLTLWKPWEPTLKALKALPP